MPVGIVIFVLYTGEVDVKVNSEFTPDQLDILAFDFTLNVVPEGIFIPVFEFEETLFTVLAVLFETFEVELSKTGVDLGTALFEDFKLFCFAFIS